jgi:hypothetical protein
VCLQTQNKVQAMEAGLRACHADVNPNLGAKTRVGTETCPYNRNRGRF